MIFHWYTGADKTMRVARIISRVSELSDELTFPEKEEMLREALSIETDPNWRASLLARLGAEFEFKKDLDRALPLYQEALDLFEPFEPSFQEIVEQYCWVLRSLVAFEYSVDPEPERLASAAMQAVTFLDMTTIIEDRRSVLFGWLARSLTQLGYRTDQQVFHQLALPAALRAHMYASEDPFILRDLAYCYFNLQDARRCWKVFQAFLEVAEPGELREKFTHFMETRFQEIGDPAEFKAPDQVQ